jgi:hypothetical protein
MTAPPKLPQSEIEAEFLFVSATLPNFWSTTFQSEKPNFFFAHAQRNALETQRRPWELLKKVA